jgi:hypothetical protein
MGKNIVYEIPEGTQPKPCNGPTCKAMIYWFKLPSGKWMCADADGQPHWGTCPDRDRFKKKKQ